MESHQKTHLLIYEESQRYIYKKENKQYKLLASSYEMNRDQRIL